MISVTAEPAAPAAAKDRTLDQVSRSRRYPTRPVRPTAIPSSLSDANPAVNAGPPKGVRDARNDRAPQPASLSTVRAMAPLRNLSRAGLLAGALLSHGTYFVAIR